MEGKESSAKTNLCAVTNTKKFIYNPGNSFYHGFIDFLIVKI